MMFKPKFTITNRINNAILKVSALTEKKPFSVRLKNLVVA